mmetsp:Transcript_31692/g.66647  ORF Transcript_31692/g.66647 Transcript_31692/m.66647 type:complete len:109 (-) Transcript_31692:755-1081(-)
MHQSEIIVNCCLMAALPSRQKPKSSRYCREPKPTIPSKAKSKKRSVITFVHTMTAKNCHEAHTYIIDHEERIINKSVVLASSPVDHSHLIMQQYQLQYPLAAPDDHNF